MAGMTRIELAVAGLEAAGLPLTDIPMVSNFDNVLGLSVLIYGRSGPVIGTKGRSRTYSDLAVGGVTVHCVYQFRYQSMAPTLGFEPRTPSLTARHSTVELHRNGANLGNRTQNLILTKNVHYHCARKACPPFTVQDGVG